MIGRYLLSLASDDNFDELEEKIDYYFSDHELLREALQASAPWNQEGNKPFAMVGNSVLDLGIVTSGRTKNKTRGKCLALASSCH